VIYCDYFWYILRTTDFYVLGLRYPYFSCGPLYSLSACLLVGTISDYRNPKSYPEIPRWAWDTHPCLQVEKEKTDFPTGTKYYPRPLESPLSGIKKHSLRCNTPLRCISRPCNQSHTPYFLACRCHSHHVIERSTLPGGFDCCRRCRALCFIYFCN